MAELPKDLHWLSVFALDRISDFVIITDADLVAPEGPRMIYVNRAVIETTEYTEEELLGRSPRIFQGKKRDQASKVRIRQALLAGKPLRERLLNFTKSGRPYWTELNISPLRDADGKIAYFLSIQRDLTAEQKALEARERDRRLALAGEKVGKIGTWSYDIDENKVLWSDGTYEILEWDQGTTPPGVDRCLGFVAVDEREVMEDLLRRCITRQEPFQWEVSGVSAKGSPLRLVVRGEAHLGTDGRAKAVVGAMRDVTEEARATEALDETLEKSRMLERHFASARRSAKIGVFDYSVAEDLQHWSQELLEMTGLSGIPFPAPAEAFISGIDKADRPQFDAHFGRAVTHGEDYSLTIRFHRPDGRMMHMQIIAEVKDNCGDRRIVGIARDVTDETEATNRLLREEERFRIIADTVSDVLWDYEIDKESWWVSPNWPQKLGLGIDGRDFAPLQWAEYIAESDRSGAVASLRAALKSGQGRWRREFKAEGADGSAVDLEINATILRHADGRAYRLLGNMRNVTTENRRREGFTRSRALEAVGQMTGGIAHDFNNLLMIIQGNTELLGMSELNEEDRESVDLITRASHAAADLTARLLSFSGQTSFNTTRVDPRELVVGLVPLLRSGLTSAIELETDVPDDILSVEADSTALEQAIINLAVNARDAMPNGGKLRIACENLVVSDEMVGTSLKLDPRRYVRISISDNGEGISEEIASKACEPFFTTKDVGKGTGLGLSTVYGFASQSGGGMQIYSEEGAGTTVNLYLPASARQSEIQHPPKEGGNTASDSQVRILLVEDQPDVRNHVERLLRRTGYAVTVAPDAKSALAILSSDDRFDVLFTDVVMPGGVNGVQLAAKAASIVPSIKVLYTSGFPASAFEDIGVVPGRELPLLRKPYKSADLVNAISAVLSKEEREPLNT